MRVMTESTILIVEDDPIVRLVTEKQIAMLGDFKTEAVSTAEAAIARFPDNICLIFMDIGLPGMDGLYATLQIRELEKQNGHKRVPIIALTGHGDRNKCIAAGMDDYLQKPTLLADIKRMLQKHLVVS